MNSQSNQADLIKLVKDNDIEKVRAAFASGIDPLMFVTHPVMYRPPNEKNANQSYEVPLMFLAESDEMKALFLEHTINANTVDDLYKILTPRMEAKSIGLFISDLIENYGELGPVDSEGYHQRNNTYLLNNIIHIGKILNHTTHTIDVVEINHVLSAIYYLLDSKYYSGNYPQIDGAILALIQASTDLQQPAYYKDQSFYKHVIPMTSPFELHLTTNVNTKEGFLKNSRMMMMINNNYSLWNDVKNKNIDTAVILSNKRSGSEKAILKNIDTIYQYFPTMCLTKYFEALNIYQMSILASKTGTLATLNADVINYIIKTIMPLVLPLPDMKDSYISSSQNTDKLHQQKLISDKNENLKTEVALFKKVYTILLENEQSYYLPSVTHTFLKDNQYARPDEFMKNAKKHANANKAGFTAKALDITKLDDKNAQVKALAHDRMSKMWLFTKSYDEIKETKKQIKKDISEKLTKK